MKSIKSNKEARALRPNLGKRKMHFLLVKSDPSEEGMSFPISDFIIFHAKTDALPDKNVLCPLGQSCYLKVTEHTGNMSICAPRST